MGQNEISRRLLSTRDAAARLSLAPDTLERWRLRGRGPTFVRLGRAVRYAEADLDAFVALHAHPAPAPPEARAAARSRRGRP